MKFIGARQELKLFQQYTTSIYSEAPPPPPAVIASQQQQQKGGIDNEGDSRVKYKFCCMIYTSKKA